MRYNATNCAINISLLRVETVETIVSFYRHCVEMCVLEENTEVVMAKDLNDIIDWQIVQE